jgi:uncharacterized protein (TIGR00369 family)
MSDPRLAHPVEHFHSIARVGWTAALGLRLVHATRDEVVAELPVADVHLQPQGIVHGGVYSTIVESLASIAAALNLVEHGKHVVGLENNVSFLRAVRQGTLRARATPLHRGRSTHVWEVGVHDEQGRLVATGRVRLLVLDASAAT